MIKNKKAYFDYEVQEEFIAGIKLLGSEIKPLRNGEANLNSAFCYINNGEVFLKDMFIADNKNTKHYTHENLRERKLLLTKKEIEKLETSLQTRGLTIIPLMVLETSTKLIKVKIGICRGKKNFDKRESIKKKDIERELNRKL